MKSGYSEWTETERDWNCDKSCEHENMHKISIFMHCNNYVVSSQGSSLAYRAVQPLTGDLADTDSYYLPAVCCHQST